MTDPEETYIGFLFLAPDRSVDEIAATVAGDLRRLFVGFPASGQWRLAWAHCAAGLELLVAIDSDLFDDAAHQQLTDVLLSGQDQVRVMYSHEIHDLLARIRDSLANGDARVL